jgi:hypothetical protein
MTRINPKGIYKHMSYDVKELTVKLHVNEKTISRWMESGLEAVPSGKPFLFHGSSLQDFLRKKDAKKKVHLKRGEFYCFTCKAPRRAKKGTTRTLRGKKHALCNVCNGKMSRTIQPAQNDYMEPLFPI